MLRFNLLVCPVFEAETLESAGCVRKPGAAEMTDDGRREAQAYRDCQDVRDQVNDGAGMAAKGCGCVCVRQLALRVRNASGRGLPIRPQTDIEP